MCCWGISLRKVNELNVSINAISFHIQQGSIYYYNTSFTLTLLFFAVFFSFIPWLTWTYSFNGVQSPAVQGLGSALHDGDMGSISTGLGLLEQTRTQHEPSRLIQPPLKAGHITLWHKLDRPFTMNPETGLNEPLKLVWMNLWNWLEWTPETGLNEPLTLVWIQPIKLALKNSWHWSEWPLETVRINL